MSLRRYHFEVGLYGTALHWMPRLELLRKTGPSKTLHGETDCRIVLPFLFRLRGRLKFSFYIFRENDSKSHKNNDIDVENESLIV